MKKTRKRLFAFSGLFVLVAQVLVMALCSIPAIAVTREETNRTLFNNEHGSATISYEEMESGGLNWTINLQKAAHDTATRFMVAMTADGQAIMPENVQTVMQSAPEISFTAGNGEGLMLAGLQEGAAGSGAGSAVITYQTSGNYGQMAVVPKLVTVGDTVSDLLAGNPGVVYDIPVKEEPAATEEAVTGELPLTEEQTATTEAPEAPEAEVVESTTDSQVAEATESTTESTVADEATVATEVTESTEAEATETTESSEAVVEGEVTESTTEDSTATTESSSEAEDETGDSSEATEASDEAAKLSDNVPTEGPDTDITSFRLEKEWILPPGTDPSDLPPITIELMQGDEVYLKEQISCPLVADENGKYITVREWKNLPIVKDSSGNTLEYNVREVDSSSYKEGTPVITESAIDEVYMENSNNSIDWEIVPTFVIARGTDGNYFVWTLNHLDEDEQKELIKNAIAHGGIEQPILGDLQKYLIGNFKNEFLWYEGASVSANFGKGSVSVNVTFNDDGSVNDANLTFGGTNVWTQFVTGGYSTRRANITNTYIPQKKIDVEKVWMNDDNNSFDTQKEIKLVLEQSTNGTDWTPVKDMVLTIPANSTGDALKGSFEVPSQIDDGNGGLIDVQYRVVEQTDGTPSDRVYGYSAKTEEYTITNTLLKTNFSFTKVDGQGNPLLGASFSLTRDDGGEWDGWEKQISNSDGLVSFSDLPFGHYTLTETGAAPGYEKPQGSWEFDVIDINGELSIDWGTAGTPFVDGKDNDGKLVNNLKPFDFTVNKVNEQGGALAGAEFTLTGPNDYKQVITSTEENPLSSFTFTDLVVPEEGTNTYTLTETKAPDGYAKLLNPIIITIGYNDEGKLTITVDGEVVEFSLNEGDANNTFTYKVANKALVPLPATGGPGTLLFFVMGILAIAVTGIYFVSRQKQEVA